MNRPRIFRLLTGILAACSLILLPASARAADDIVFTFTAAGTYACGPGGNTTLPCDLNGYYKVSVQVTCPGGGCTGEVDMQQRNTNTDPNFSGTIIAFVNPGANDQGYSNVGFGQIQFVVQGGWSGTGRITIVRNK